jgi:hypothetical protein
MSNSYVLLEKVVVGSAGASSVTFANIPQTGYTDLKIVISTRGTSSDTPVAVQFNSVTTGYSWRRIYGSGSAASSQSGTDNYFMYHETSSQTASTFGSGELYIPNYTGSQAKSCSADSLNENNATAADMFMLAGLNTMTAAITSITFTPYSGNFAANSTFYLYGVAKLGTTPTIAPKATGGDVIDTDGTYWYHIFRSSGTFTPATALTCDYLVVAGGGGGGGRRGAAGGAGGLRSTVTATGGGGSLETALSLASATNYTVTVGAGGAGGSGAAGSGAATDGSNGSNSVFSTITSTAGGGGAGDGRSTANIGGSGGGGSNGAGGAGTINQGYAGGSGPNTAPNYGGGGGGGANAVGANGTSTTGGAGGAGVAVAITGSSVTYAGGGGGGTYQGGTSGVGGAGGGGAGGTGGTDNNGTAGTANTGGGGGGGSIQADSSNRAGGAGGSGIVVVRYLVA